MSRSFSFFPTGSDLVTDTHAPPPHRGRWRKRLGLAGVLALGAGMAVATVSTTAQAGDLNGGTPGVIVEGTPPPPSYSPAPGTTNLALNRPATASPACASSEGPAKAVDGRVDGMDKKWCSTYSGDKVLEIDLGDDPQRLIGSFVIKHAEAGGETPTWNTRSFAIYTRNSTSVAWGNAKVYVNNNTLKESVHQLPNLLQDRYVQLKIYQGAQLSHANVARIYDFEVRTPQNLAINATVAGTGTQCAANEGPEKATDGNMSTKWCAANTANTLMVKIPSGKKIQGFRVFHAQAGGETSGYNTRKFSIDVGAPNTLSSTDANIYTSPEINQAVTTVTNVNVPPTAYAEVGSSTTWAGYKLKVLPGWAQQNSPSQNWIDTYMAGQWPIYAGSNIQAAPAPPSMHARIYEFQVYGY